MPVVEPSRAGIIVDETEPPVTVKFPGTGGYAAILEADLRNYAGMVLQAAGGFAIRFLPS